MFKINNKNTRTTFLSYFIFYFEQVDVSWVVSFCNKSLKSLMFSRGLKRKQWYKFFFKIKIHQKDFIGQNDIGHFFCKKKDGMEKS